ncbi:MAG: hypothetical protein H6983_25090 [Ectothiorhodospiraceae bacterium]|nr:hypothetical protein [Chromatiales bacterium]MCP5157475.1 hypothetical protein [Ectothiorhodospiraceae bacterium]
MHWWRAHLDDVGETYLQHLGHALSFSVTMFLGAAACLVHALLPFAFVRTGSDCIRRLHDRMVVNRRNLTPGAFERAQALREGGSGA